VTHAGKRAHDVDDVTVPGNEARGPALDRGGHQPGIWNSGEHDRFHPGMLAADVLEDIQTNYTLGSG
jgi:hypothetical protein